MPLTLHQFEIPNGNDNVNYIIREESGGAVAVIDPTDAALSIAELNKLGWQPDIILCTHHHWDHVDGISGIVERYSCEVVGYGPDAARIPHITRTIEEGNSINVGEAKAKILFLPGHTSGHIAYYFAGEKLLFSGDVLFGMGCGRVFEGTMQQMYDALNIIKALPDEVRVCCAHEYTLTNAEFVASLTPDNASIKARIDTVRTLRAEGMRTVPLLLGEEKQSNPFLLADSVEEFTTIRQLRNSW